MGDYYEFDCKIIDGKEVYGFVFSNSSTGWNEIFVEFTEEQAEQANEWQDKVHQLDLEREEMIASWIADKH